jgi:hypothetical protein
MKQPHWYTFTGILAILIVPAWTIIHADDTAPATSQELTVEHADCDYFGAARDKYVSQALGGTSAVRNRRSLSAITEDVGTMLGYVPGGSRTHSFEQTPSAGSIDDFIYADLQANGIRPANKTNDFEFIRRVTLDLTGRIPTADRVLKFTADTAPDKRNKLIDELLAKPEWVDKWTMFYGDLYKNTDNRPTSGIRRFNEGRNAFYKWINSSLAANKPYNQMAAELISATGNNSYNDGPTNFLVGYIATGGPQQDITDSMTAGIMETFLGISHVNCVLCHNGRGHLDNLSLWAKTTTRYQAWQLSSYLSHTQQTRTPVDMSNPNIFYWAQLDNTKGYTNDYTLNTLTGNRPARQPLTQNCRAGQPCYYVQPEYIFSGVGPKQGENYRVALARQVTSDFQFARATVNYIWDQFFSRGIVDPPNSFDPLRLDPDNPPPDPWTLQPSNARLLNALAQGFIDNNYNLKWLMKTITSSDTYQMSARYDGQWKPDYEKFFARKYVRRLWGEEVHDAIALSSGTIPTYNVPGFSNLGFSPINYAMQAPDVIGTPTPQMAGFLDAFLRGNRDDNERKGEGSVQQTLDLMNDPFVMSRIQAGTGGNTLVNSNLNKSDDELVNALFLNILSRYPTAAEKTRAVAAIKGAAFRAQGALDVVWALYNKVDFVFNY